MTASLTDIQKQKISKLQQAVWKLNEAKNLVEEAIGADPSDQWISYSLYEIVYEIEEEWIKGVYTNGN